MLHTAVGIVTLLPLLYYSLAHWRDYRRFNLSDVVLLGYVAVAALAVSTIALVAT